MSQELHDELGQFVNAMKLDAVAIRAAAIEHCVNLWRTRLDPARLSLSVDEHIDALDEARTLAIYRTIQEALTNCARHAHASRVDVRIDWTADGVQGAAAAVRVEEARFRSTAHRGPDFAFVNA